MRKIIFGIISSCLVFCGLLSNSGVFSSSDLTTAYAMAKGEAQLVSDCKSAYLCDYFSGECIYEYNPTERMPIASVCKVMTLNLCFEAIEQGKLDMNAKICVSKNASGMGGSQVFLKDGLSYDVEQLIKSIVVCSANDSCVALAEAVCGSEDEFVALMNSRAIEYGCNDTLFANCTGLPKDTQYSCAKDVAVMFRHLLSYEKYFNFSKIWLEDFIHPDGRTTSMTNTNKLIRRYSPCDGGKTGFTNEAGFCLTSTAQKDNLRLVSVVLGSNSSDTRFASTVNMFNYGFANYKNSIVLDDTVNLNESVAVLGAKKEVISVKPSRISSVFNKKGEKLDITFNFIPQKLYAPVKKGDLAGKMEVYKNGVLYDTVDIVAAEDAQKASYFDNAKKIAGMWRL
ncbi:MAG: D-alanyl-D-alanine carboxypeptidase family protein [Candidatus Coproplasma sp.]